MIEYCGKKIIFMLCSDCNIKCEHCYIGYKGNRDPDEILRLTKKLKKKYVIFFNGTEILLELKYLKCLKEVGQYSIMSNGILLKDEKIRQQLKKYGIKRIGISYHMDMQNKISKINDEYILSLIRTLVNEGFEVKLMTTITNKNYYKILEFCEVARNLKVHTIKFTNFLRSGNAKNMKEDLTLNKDQLNTFFNLLEEARRKYDKKILNIARCGTFGNNIEHKTNFLCPAITNQVTITPDNKVYPCFFLAGVVDPIGELINDKVYLYENYKHNCSECITKNLFANRGE